MITNGLVDKFIPTNGITLHMIQSGPLEGPLVVLLHGFPEFWYSWRKQIGPLAEAGYQVLAPDQRGYNLSDKNPPYDILTLVEDIAGLIWACGKEEALVVGHDWGAVVAWGLAIQHPEMVRKLVILNVPHPAVMSRALMGGSLRQILKSWYIFAFQIPKLPEWLLSRNNFARMRKMMRSSAHSDTFSAEDLDHYAQAWAQPGALSASIGWYRALASGMNQRKLFERKVRVPTLVLWGEQDIALDINVGLQSLDWVENGRAIRYPDATHWVHEDKPAEITQALIDFFGPL